MTTIIDYHAGNLTSVRLAFEAIGESVRISSDAGEIARATRLVFPGVGAAGSAMENLRALGLVGAIRDAVAAGTPFLGICLGTQILFERSEEDGGTECLGILKGGVKRFVPRSHADKVPEMGWNQAWQVRRHPVFDGIGDGTDFYFVHSFYPAPAETGDRVAETEYCGIRFASSVGRGNLVATQFHPEKSGEAGLRLLRNFAAWDGR